VIERDDMLGPGVRTWPWPEHAQMMIRLGFRRSVAPAPPRNGHEAIRPAEAFHLTH